ncbi:hypothetical protein NQ315_009596 [Exocentrus adspersus]|uniref:Uncharacterized protein n=1 Tax=Exocentrus adspersus TaxID=1586481 RepID=A0AAV8WGN3_9CUCU|nr:hypothetical protein NQ315_009596 [Exocentrus adspersus]
MTGGSEEDGLWLRRGSMAVPKRRLKRMAGGSEEDGSRFRRGWRMVMKRMDPVSKRRTDCSEEDGGWQFRRGQLIVMKRMGGGSEEDCCRLQGGWLAVLRRMANGYEEDGQARNGERLILKPTVFMEERRGGGAISGGRRTPAYGSDGSEGNGLAVVGNEVPAKRRELPGTLSLLLQGPRTRTIDEANQRFLIRWRVEGRFRGQRTKRGENSVDGGSRLRDGPDGTTATGDQDRDDGYGRRFPTSSGEMMGRRPAGDGMTAEWRRTAVPRASA